MFPGRAASSWLTNCSHGLTVRVLRLLNVKDPVEENDDSPPPFFPLSPSFAPPPPILSPMDLGSSKSPRAFGQGFAKPSGSLLEDSKSSRWGGGGVKERATFAFLADL